MPGTRPVSTTVDMDIHPEQRFDRALELARGGRSLETQRDLVGARAQYEHALALLKDVDPTPLLAKILRVV